MNWCAHSIDRSTETRERDEALEQQSAGRALAIEEEACCTAPQKVGIEGDGQNSGNLSVSREGPERGAVPPDGADDRRDGSRRLALCHRERPVRF